ncbi:Lin1244/Lin1753 domain-containing protein [Gracilibacillus saliphilus]|uniref:Lin1244/Lin1753 domain-containing protein n=1 Tax=Gracilibacillus saliphilus TaxID=543890 RepID=UPI0013D0EA9B|nr:Lin1244/Lin1753 domain-containing protein [Gracilibacillus saliphilus]
MARKIKEGLDYFPLDVDIDQDEKVALIEAKHGAAGFAIIIKLLMKIYKNSYFYQWGEKEQLLFSKIINVDINLINDVINDCLKWGLFSQEKFDNYEILTSRGIQERFLEATSRRKEPKIVQEYCLLSEKEVNAYNYLIIVNKNGESVRVIDNKSTQSKGKVNKDLNNNKGEISSLNTARFFDEHVAPISPIVAEQIDDWEQDFPPEILIRAMKEAVVQNKRSWKYVESILRDWKNKGAKTLNDAEALVEQFNQSKVKPFRKNPGERKVADF